MPKGDGAKMLVYQDGKILESIGSGSVIGQARHLIGSKTFKLVDIDLTGDAAEKGMAIELKSLS